MSPAPSPGNLPRLRMTQTAGQRPAFEIDGPASTENYSFTYPYGLGDDRVKVQVEFMAIIDRGDGRQPAEVQPEPDAPAPVTVNVTVHSSLTTEQDIARAINQHLLRRGMGGYTAYRR